MDSSSPEQAPDEAISTATSMATSPITLYPPRTLPSGTSAFDGCRSLNVMMIHMLMNVACNTIVVGTRPVMLVGLMKGDAAKANARLAQWAGLIGLTEFLVNPALGRLSDNIGRKPFLLLGPVTNFLFKFLVFLKPSMRTLMLERVVCGALTTVSGSTSCSAVMSDLSPGKGLAVTGAGLGSYAGAGCVVGPLMGGQLLARTGSVRLPFLAAALIALADAIHVLRSFDETLEASVPWDWEAINPLRVIKLFQARTSLAFKKLLLASALMCFPEGKNLSDFNQLYILKHVKMSPDWRTMFTVGFGAAMMLGGKLAQRTLGLLGQRGHTSFSNALTMVGLCVWAYNPSICNMFAGLVVLTGAMERRAATNAQLTKQALEAGFQRGEFAGLFANYRALTTFVAPLFYSKVYSYYAVKKSYQGAPYVAAGFITILGEFVLQTMTDKQLDL